MKRKVKNYLDWYNCKKLYFNRDLIVYWNLNNHQEKQFKRMLNNELSVWINTNIQSFLSNNYVTNLLDSTIRIKKSDTFVNNGKLNNSSGVLDIELYLEYLDMYDNYDNHTIQTTLIFQNGKIK